MAYDRLSSGALYRQPVNGDKMKRVFRRAVAPHGIVAVALDHPHGVEQPAKRVVDFMRHGRGVAADQRAPLAFQVDIDGG